MPPRAGKSYITTLFVAWFLGKRPTESVMRNSSTARLYERFSYDARDIIKSEAFKEVFPGINLAADKQNIHGWNLEQSTQVGYFGAGVGGTIIGFGASGVAITDDLYKSIDDALSETTNANVHRWKESAHDSRMEKGCARIDIGTRWCLNDVIGVNIERGAYDKVIIIPALIDGKSFCEDVQTTEAYEEIRKKLFDMPEIWQAEYMQQPIQVEGLLFRPESLKRFRRADYKPDGREAVLAYIDVADQGTDSYAMPIGSIHKGKVFVTDVVFSRDTVDITLPLTVGAIKEKKIDLVRVESNNQGMMFARMLRQYVEPAIVMPITNTTNKATRILMQYGFIKDYVYFLHPDDIKPGSPYDLFMRQVFGYMKNGTSKHDDAPDALAGLAMFAGSYLPHLFETQGMLNQS